MNAVQEHVDTLPDSNDVNYIILDDNGLLALFANDSDLRAWANNSDTSGAIMALLNKQDSLIDYATQRGIIDDSLATISYTDSLIAAEAAANANPTPVVTALYDGYNYTGVQYWLPFVSFRPSFGSFNGKASSLSDRFLLPKLNMLASRTWFRGSKYIYWSYTLKPDLRVVNFDNKAKSKL